HRQQALALGALARQLAGAAHGLGLFAGAPLGRLLVVTAHLPFTENALALHLLLQRAKSLVNVVVADEYLHGRSCLSCLKSAGKQPRPPASAGESTANWGGQ